MNYVTSTKTQAKGNTPTASNGGTVAFTTESIDEGREIIRGYEAKELAAYVSSVRQFAQVISKIDKGQRTEWKAELAKPYTVTDKAGNVVEVPAVSMGTVDAMVGVGQWVLALNALGVTVAEIQGLGISKSALQKGTRIKALDKVNRDDVPDPLNLGWLYEVGALKDPATKANSGSREARPEGNDMDAPTEGTSAPMGGNETPKGSEFAEFRRLAAKFANMSGPYEKQTAEEREQLAYSLGRCVAQNKAVTATV